VVDFGMINVGRSGFAIEEGWVLDGGEEGGRGTVRGGRSTGRRRRILRRGGVESATVEEERGAEEEGRVRAEEETRGRCEEEGHPKGGKEMKIPWRVLR